MTGRPIRRARPPTQGRGPQTRLRKPLMAALAGCALSLAAMGSLATEVAESAFNWRGKVELQSDNRERGLSDSANRPSAELTLELLHASGVFAGIELARVDKTQYPGARGLRIQSDAGWRFGDPDRWQFEIGAQHSRFPGARQPGATGYSLVIDPEMGEVVDAVILPTTVRFDTTEAFVSVRRGPVQLRYFHTLSRDFFAINARSVCPGIEDVVESFACFERGPQHSRGSGYLELEFTHRLSRAASVDLRLGQQRVRHWRSFDTRSFALAYRHAWRSFELGLAITGAKAREKGAYDIRLPDGRVRNPGKTTAVVTAGYLF
jgi:Bacterial protein of unknown function (Gcw_chp)